MTDTTSFKVYNASAGSGKTFTLVKEYLKILLTSKSEFVFQNILAITFTNKAAAEMKERVLENLRSFAEGDSNDMFDLIIQEYNLDAKKLQQKSKRILENVLQNYSAFNITTIDSFTHKLIRTFAYDLDLPMNFEVEMDGSKLISEAVDLLISKIGISKELTDVLVAFSLQKIEDDKAWDISRELNGIASILLNETDSAHVEKLQSKSLNDFKEIEQKLRKKKEEIEKRFEQNGLAGLELIEQHGLVHKSFSYSELPKHFIKFKKLSTLKVEDIKYTGRLQKNIDNGVWYSKSTKKDIQDAIDSIKLELLRIYDEGRLLYDQLYGDYIMIGLVLREIIPLAVLNHVQKELNEIKEHNSICLSAEFNSLISKKIKNEPAPFIYERIGEKFTHFFIDEMQDTSSLQWQNLIPLINNTLSQEGGSLMLVGDAKQAIYRWRGGKAEQFIDLSIEGNKQLNRNPFYIKKQLNSLDTNYRSFSEIIQFNNSFFSHIASFLVNPTYKGLYEMGNKQELNKNIGGYVQLDFVDKSDLSKEEKDLSYPKKVLEIIEGLDTNFKKQDVCIIVRTKSDGIAIANYLTENGISIISSETLLLNNSLKVQFIIDILTYIQNPLNLNAKFKALNYLKDFLTISESEHNYYAELLELEPVAFFDKLLAYNFVFDYGAFLQMPFYESIEYLIRSFKLLKTTDAYVQFFLDYVLDFQRKNYHDLYGFLLEWDQKKEKLSIAAAESEDAVRIMTIHKSKGLEFPVVIFPSERVVDKELDPKVWVEGLEESVFGDLSMSRVSCSKNIGFTGDKGAQIFEERQSELFLDNFNLLYVALTRSAEQLYVVTEYNLDKRSGDERLNHFSGLFINYLKSLEGDNKWNPAKMTYCFGENIESLSDKKNKEKEGFEFQEKFISSSWENHQIKIVSNSSVHWGEDHEFAVSYGLLIHEMLSKIITEKDIVSVVDSYFNLGLVQKDELDSVKMKIENVVFHEELNPFFNGGFEVFTEREIIDENKNILIPDRIMIKNGQVVVVDFKTGNESDSYKSQVESYARVLSELGLEVICKYIVYIGEEIGLVSW